MEFLGGREPARNILARWTIDRALSLGASVLHEYKNLAAVDALKKERVQ
jgi:hypothetical protein